MYIQWFQSDFPLLDEGYSNCLKSLLTFNFNFFKVCFTVMLTYTVMRMYIHAFQTKFDTGRIMETKFYH